MKKKKNRSNQSKKQKNIMIAIGLFVVSCLVGLIFFISGKQSVKESKKENTTDEVPTKEVNTPKINIVDLNSKSRNVAVMINNIKTVWGYQSGIQDAYIVYEIIAEGGITRLMGIFKDAKTERIGTVRSARIYYLDYVLENDAIYVHIGGSKEAKSDIKTLGVNDLESDVTFRDKSIGLRYEHTAFTSMERINKRIDSRKYRNTLKKDLLLDYSIDEVNLSSMEGVKQANHVFISYSASKNTSFEYDAENKVYKRYQNKKEHVDYVTKKQYTVKNIITYQVKNTSYDSYGRQKLDNIGSGEGYYITNGYAVPITWEKKSREGQTVYRYKNGEEIKVNDGNTHIQIQPKGRELTIE